MQKYKKSFLLAEKDFFIFDTHIIILKIYKNVLWIDKMRSMGYNFPTYKGEVRLYEKVNYAVI